ncbi:MAG: hypothetical protein ACLFP1_04680 [Candidatus Goldiibacteriota bacterium]
MSGKIPVNYYSVFISAVSLYKKNFFGFLTIILAGIAAAAFAQFINSLAINAVTGAVLSIIAYIINILSLIALIIAVSRAYKGLDFSFSGCYNAAMKRFFRFLGYTVLLLIIIFAGFILLFIPGVIFYILFFFTTIIAVLEEEKVSPLNRSRELVRGYFWSLLGFFLLITIVFFSGWLLFVILAGLLAFITTVLNPLFMVVLIVCAAVVWAVITVILTPFFTIFQVLLYYRFIEIKEGPELNKKKAAAPRLTRKITPSSKKKPAAKTPRQPKKKTAKKKIPKRAGKTAKPRRKNNPSADRTSRKK